MCLHSLRDYKSCHYLTLFNEALYKIICKVAEFFIQGNLYCCYIKSLQDDLTLCTQTLTHNVAALSIQDDLFVAALFTKPITDDHGLSTG